MQRSCIAQRRWCFFRLLFTFTCSRGAVAPLWLPAVDRMENAIEPDDIMADCIEQILLVDLETDPKYEYALILFTKKVMKMNTKSKSKVPSRTSARVDHLATTYATEREHQRTEQKIEEQAACKIIIAKFRNRQRKQLTRTRTTISSDRNDDESHSTRSLFNTSLLF